MAATPSGLNNALAYVWGNCTYFVAKTLSWVPAGLGNAKDWLANAQRKGFSISQTPTPGDVVVYGPGGGYDPHFGHVAVVKSVQSAGQFTVNEMNFKGTNIMDTRVSSMRSVLGFIEPPKSAMGNNANPFDVAGAIGNLGGSISGSINKGFADTALALNPEHWLLALWDDHLKGNMTRIVLVVFGLWLIIIGLSIMFQQEAQSIMNSDSGDSSDTKTTPIAAPTRAAPAESTAAEAAPIAAV